MLEKLKSWTLSVLECLPNDIESCSDFNYYTRESDPRELPRPRKYPSLELPMPPAKEEVRISTNKGCNCYNCRELGELYECPICTGNYKKGVATCEHCANVTCYTCASRLPECPFCRRPRLAARNTALERIFNKLQVPCKPSSYVEKVETCKEHCCIANKNCLWIGGLGDLASHLESDHRFSVLVASAITIEIAGFRSKVKASEKLGRHYTVSLACYASIFVCSILLHKKKLMLAFSGASSHSSQKFAAWLEVNSSYRTMKGIMPVSAINENQKNLYISCNGLLSPWRKNNDKVRMMVTIRPIS